MKNFIYFTFVALIFLSACKTNSFTRQRYTKLGHAGHKSVKHQNNPSLEIIRETSVSMVEEELIRPDVAPVSEQAIASAEPGLSKTGFSAPKKIIMPLVHKSAEIYYQLKDDGNKDSKKLDTKKTFKEKIHHAAGIFNTALKIVLFAVVLAILVAIIIIIILT